MIVLYLLGLKRLLVRPVIVLLSIAGIAGGVSLVISVNVVLSSVARSIEEVSDLSDQADLTLTARSPVGFPVELVDQAASDPSVVSIDAQLLSAGLIGDQETIIIGRRDVLTPMRGSVFTAENLVVRARGLTTEIAAQPAPPGLDTINSGAVLLVPLEVAWELTGRHGLVDTAPLTLLGPADGVAERLENELGSEVFVAPADAQQQFALQQLEQVQQPLLLMATIALIAGGALVFNTIQNSARAQARELAVLRAVGAGRRQVAGGLLVEALTLGIAGSMVGVAGGAVLGRTIVGVLPDLVHAVSGTTVRFHWDWRVLPGAVLAGVVVALLSAALPIRAMLRTRPDHVLARRPHASHGSSIRPRAIILGLAAIVTGGVMTRSTEISIAQNGIGLLFLGMLVAGFGLSGPIAQASAAVAIRFGALGSLTAQDIRGSDRRVWSVAAAVFVAVGTALTVGGAARNQGDTLNEQFGPAKTVDLWVSAAQPDDLPLGFYYPSASIDQLAAVEGVEDVRAMITMFSVVEDEQIIVLASDEALTMPSLKLAGGDAVERVVRGEAVVVTIQFARAFGLSVGDMVDIPGSTGRVQLPIAGVTRATTLSISGAVHMNRTAFIGAFGDPGVNTFELQTADGTDLGQVAQDVRTVLDPSGAPVVIATGQQWFDGVIESTEEAINVFLVVSSVVVAVAGLATLNATVSSVVERRRQLGVLRSLGATPQQVRSMVLIEAGSAGLVGAVLGSVAGIGMHRLAVYVTTNSTPFPQDYFFSWPAVIQALASAAVAVTVGGLLPAIQASRLRIADALAYD